MIRLILPDINEINKLKGILIYFEGKYIVYVRSYMNGVVCRVSGDELTGLCHVRQSSIVLLEVTPQGLLLVAGAVLGTMAATSLVTVRKEVIKSGGSAAKLERLMTRLAVFTALFVFPALGTLACSLYQAFRTEPPGQPADLEVTLLRVFLSLVMGTSSGMWVWSGKTWRVWSRMCRRVHKPQPLPMDRIW